MPISNILDENRPVLVATFILLFIGFLLGFRPQFYEPVIKQAQEISEESFRDIPLSTFSIFSNNAQVAVYSAIGGFVLLPTLYLAIFGVGVAYGAIAATTPTWYFLLVLATFALLELYALVLAITAGLLFPKYALSRVLGQSETFRETLKNAGVLLGLSIALLIPSAFIEALFLYSAAFNPNILISSSLLGLFVTIVCLYITLRRK